MRKKLLITGILFGLCLSLCFGAQFAGVGQKLHTSLRLFRTIASVDTAIDLSTAGDFASMPAGVFRFATDQMGHGSTVINTSFSICGTGGENTTIPWNYYSWRKSNGACVLVASGTATLGTQAVVIFPEGGTATGYTWADTITVTSQYTLAPMVAPEDQANNSICKTGRRNWGDEYGFFEWVTGGTATAVKVYVEWN